MIDLRMRVLLEPIGIPRSYIDPVKEASDILVGAYDGAQLAGCCILTRLDETTVQVRQMAVSASHQQKGIGRAVLSFAETLARNQGYPVLKLHARETVVDFYRKCDYVIVGNPFVEVGIRHWVMQKQLSAVATNDM